MCHFSQAAHRRLFVLSALFIVLVGSTVLSPSTSTFAASAPGSSRLPHSVTGGGGGGSECLQAVSENGFTYAGSENAILERDVSFTLQNVCSSPTNGYISLQVHVSQCEYEPSTAFDAINYPYDLAPRATLSLGGSVRGACMNYCECGSVEIGQFLMIWYVRDISHQNALLTDEGYGTFFGWPPYLGTPAAPPQGAFAVANLLP